ncbi:alpha/beta fold hydrolase [Rhodococcus zopfii]|uniref:alpha/beta fold hydrolase n=1 Tax=Rhodococcus zopfii TaxID=43772 RepID=UPI0009336283|nr:alpha/beta fold hydrolase [Rhodococcus zopfii]
MVSYPSDDEFALLPENAAALGLKLDAPPVVQRVGTDIREGVHVSSLLWATAPPRVVFLHDNGQGAHAWDALNLALGLPALAVDLPGHGHSTPFDAPDHSPWHAADAVAHAVRRWAPDAEAVVGASLGGLATIRLAAIVPELVRRAIVLDVTPSTRLTDDHDLSPLWDDLAGIGVPLTLIRGGASDFVPDADADEVRRRNPAARILAVPRAGHAVHRDAPRELAEIIGSSLETA